MDKSFRELGLLFRDTRRQDSLLHRDLFSGFVRFIPPLPDFMSKVL